MRLNTASTCWNVPVKYVLHGELFFFLIRKEPVVASNDVSSKTFVSAETLKACALIGPHLLAAEGEAGYMWRHGCPTSPEWISFCSASEIYCGGEEYEHNDECRATEVIGQDWSSEVVALFLEDWELGRVALRCHATMNLHCQVMRDACWASSELVLLGKKNSGNRTIAILHTTNHLTMRLIMGCQVCW